MFVSKISNQYSIFQLLKLVILKSFTIIFYPGQRIIRTPFIVRGKKMIKFGKNLTTGKHCRLEAFIADGDKSEKIFLGDDIQFNDYVHISALKQIIIGNNVLMASNVYISDNSHGYYKGTKDDTDPFIPPQKRIYFVDPVVIGDNVWIGEGAIIMPGVKIGKGAVIGAHSIVNSDIPENNLAVGAPAVPIKHYNPITKMWEKVNKS